MITFCAARLTFVALLAALAAGCSPEQQDWRSAEAADSSEAYTHFLEQHADSELATQARTRIQQLQEERDWGNRGWHRDDRGVPGFRGAAPDRKVGRGSAHPHRGFLARLGPAFAAAGPDSRQPQGRARAAARHRRGGRAGSVTAGIRASDGGGHRGGCRARSCRPGAAGTGVGGKRGGVAPPQTSADGYGVQFGAFGSQASADREWQRLQGRFGAQLRRACPAHRRGQHQRRSALPPAGAGRRRSQARALCDALKEQSQACVPVHPALTRRPRKRPSVFTDGRVLSEAHSAALGLKVTIRVRSWPVSSVSISLCFHYSLSTWHIPCF